MTEEGKVGGRWGKDGTEIQLHQRVSESLPLLKLKGISGIMQSEQGGL